MEMRSSWVALTLNPRETEQDTLGHTEGGPGSRGWRGQWRGHKPSPGGGRKDGGTGGGSRSAEGACPAAAPRPTACKPQCVWGLSRRPQDTGPGVTF